MRELAAESIGRITRRGLEPQLAQVEAALDPDEHTVAVAPGRDGTAGVVVALTDRRLLISVGAPFTQPALQVIARSDIASATADAGDGAWALRVDHAQDRLTVPEMFDRDAQRLAALLSSDPAG